MFKLMSAAAAAAGCAAAVWYWSEEKQKKSVPQLKCQEKSDAIEYQNHHSGITNPERTVPVLGGDDDSHLERPAETESRSQQPSDLPNTTRQPPSNENVGCNHSPPVQSHRDGDDSIGRGSSHRGTGDRVRGSGNFPLPFWKSPTPPSTDNRKSNSPESLTNQPPSTEDHAEQDAQYNTDDCSERSSRPFNVEQRAEDNSDNAHPSKHHTSFANPEKLPRKSPGDIQKQESPSATAETDGRRTKSTPRNQVYPFNKSWLTLSSRCSGTVKFDVCARHGFYEVLDHAHVKRRIKLMTKVKVIAVSSQGTGNQIVVTARGVDQKENVKTLEEMLSLALKGWHYRQEWIDLRKIARNISKELSKAVIKASEEARETAFQCYLSFYNSGSSVRKIDLHGILVEEVESALQKGIEQFLQWKKETPKHKRGLQDWLQVVVGAGNHSPDGVQKLRPKAEELLEKWQRTSEYDYRIEVLNKGCLLLLFSEYRGDDDQKVTASFYCMKCEHNWISARAWPHCWQKCSTCYSRCYPLLLFSPFHVKVHCEVEEEIIEREPQRGHASHLCQVCQDLQKKTGRSDVTCWSIGLQ